MPPSEPPSDPNDPLDPNSPQSNKPAKESDTQRAYESVPEADRPATNSPTKRDLESQTPGGSDSEGHDPYAAWRFRNFRLYTTGSFSWWMGRQMLGVVIGWQIYDLTNSAAALGLVGLLEAIPLIALALPAGHLADRLNRKTITMIMTTFIALCSLALAVLSDTLVTIPQYSILTQINETLTLIAWTLGETNTSFDNPVIPLLFLLFFLAGVAQAFGGPSRSALLPSIIPIEHFSNAVTWNSNIAQISSMAGPAVGGMLLWLLAGRDYAFSAIYLIDAICIGVFTLTLAGIRYTHKQPKKIESIRENVSAGVRFVFKQKIILATLTLDMFAVLLGGAVILLPVYAKDILNVGPWGFGWLRAAPALGAFVMALILAHAPPMKKAGRNLLWSVAGFGLATVVFGLSHWFWLSLIALFMTGMLDNISVVIRHTLVQVLTPDSMRGRVSAVNNIFIGSSNELGAFRAGVMAAIFGPVIAVAGGGIASIVVVGVVAVAWPQVRKFGSLKDARPMDDE